MKYRKYIAFFLTLVMVFTLAACGGDKEEAASLGETVERSSGLKASDSSSKAADTADSQELDWWEGQW